MLAISFIVILKGFGKQILDTIILHLDASNKKIVKE